MLAISLDDVAAQKAFAEAQKLDYPVLSDPDGSAAGKYQVLTVGGKYASRVTFVVDPEGLIRHVDRNVNVSAHGAELAEVLKKLRAASRARRVRCLP